jgi:hypothetical protein
LPNGAANGFNVAWFMKVNNSGDFDESNIEQASGNVIGINTPINACGIFKASTSFYMSGGTILDKADAIDKK